jgi:hypothetical protein
METESNTTIIIKFGIEEKVPAGQFVSLISGIEKFYSLSLWLDLVDTKSEDIDYTDKIALSADQVLWLEGLEIGTPNWAKIKGKTSQLLIASSIIVGLLAGPEAITKFVDSYAKARVAIIESKFIKQHKQLGLEKAKLQLKNLREEYYNKEIENIKGKLDIIERLEKLRKDGNISEKSYQKLIEDLPKIKKDFNNGAGLIIPNSISLIIPEHSEEFAIEI